MGDEEGLLSEEEVAALLQQMPVSMVRRLHREGAGPPCVEIGRHARYRHAVVQRWLGGDGQSSSPAENR
jgi:Helix-turn-helix domain